MDYRQAADRWLDKIDNRKFTWDPEQGRYVNGYGETMGEPGFSPYSRRTPLRTSQHILHLLLTVFTGGLWAPVWIVLAVRGNRAAGQPGR